MRETNYFNLQGDREKGGKTVSYIDRTKHEDKIETKPDALNKAETDDEVMIDVELLQAEYKKNTFRPEYQVYRNVVIGKGFMVGCGK